jgi:hypothetical protein
MSGARAADVIDRVMRCRWCGRPMWSAMNNKQGTRDFDRDLMLRLAEQEAVSRMNANLNRPVLTWIVATAAALPNEDLDLLAQTALAIFRARAATDSDPEPTSPSGLSWLGREGWRLPGLVSARAIRRFAERARVMTNRYHGPPRRPGMA